MSVQPDGTVVCDGCGYNLGNGSIDKCIIVADVGTIEEGGVRGYNFCRTHDDSKGHEVKGCGEKMLTAKVLAYYNATREGVKTNAGASATDTGGTAHDPASEHR
jgi:hypothetical protein